MISAGIKILYNLLPDFLKQLHVSKNTKVSRGQSHMK